MSEGSGDPCQFGNLEGCRLFKVAFSHSPQNGFKIDPNRFEQVLEQSAVLPVMSPNGKAIAFRGGSSANGVEALASYVYSLLTDTIVNVSSGTFNGQAHWPFWWDDTHLFASNVTDCSNGQKGCSKSSRYEDLVLFTLSADYSYVEESGLFLGGIDTLSGVISDACSFSNPVVNPKNPNLIGFHSSPVDGSGKIQDGSCPFLKGLGGDFLTDGAQPIPVVVNLENALLKKSISEWKAGEDYYSFDLKSAEISGCAHLDFNEKGQVICIEQGTQEGERFCSNSQTSLQDCTRSGYSVVQKSKLYGFELINGMFTTIRSPGEALFRHVDPWDLPDASRYWHDDEPCQLYATKYAHACGEDTLVATVQCTASNSTSTSGFDTSFSRMMFIEYSDPDHPLYFDLTSWAEDAFPERWTEGSATGFSASCHSL